ncbi:AIR synthase family protein, partial [Candidatus Bathyarchaeota archaeon]|nr:AIR synthase family protein [Candidatus Bathyarchaeota archaeon]
ARDASRMQLGKPSRKVMADTVGRFVGAKSRDIIVGPRAGVDVSVVKIDSRHVMIVSCDPISFIPSMGPEASARMSVYEVASDVATSGIPPKHAMVDFNLPPHISDQSFKRYWRSFHDSCLELGISIVGGHSGRFEGCDYSVIGGATLWTSCDKREYVTSMMAQDDDDLILTKSAAYGATSVLTRAFPRTVGKALGPLLFHKAKQYLLQSNTVKDAITAASIGIHEQGVTAMHDATEGGVVAALLDVADASGLGGNISLDAIPISEETRQLCKFFRIDPLVSLGEGSLVISTRPHRTQAIIDKLRSKGIKGTVVGRLSSNLRGIRATSRKGSVQLRYPTNDPYWHAYWTSVRKGWS